MNLNIYNTTISKSSVDTLLQKNLDYNDYGLFYPNYDNINIFSQPVIPSENGTILSLEQVNRSKVNAEYLGLLVDAQYTISEITSEVFLRLPVNDTPEGAYTLLNLLKLNYVGSQCILKFSRYGYNKNTNWPVYLISFNESSNNIIFKSSNLTNNNSNYIKIFEENCTNPYTLVIATAISTNPSDAKIEFKTLYLSDTCTNYINLNKGIRPTKPPKTPKFPPDYVPAPPPPMFAPGGYIFTHQ